MKGFITRFMACERKVKHRSEKSALRAINRYESEKTMNVYLCKYCGYFHVGHRMKAEK